MTQMREKISRLENVATKVDEMSILLSQIQASQTRTQHVPPAVQSGSDSETDEAADDYSDHGVEDHADFDHSVIGSESIAEVEHDTLSVSCSSSNITPMKRVAADTFNQPNSSEDLTPVQMSCNKKKHIKIEKNDVDNFEE
ncbi:hypothetical protein Taro_013864 [Colocasia esculenta]|uniref:Uncharacterized protein n=1 Tax=Colocasia esculenta TaxID=4460 RepID=A0A843UHB5_COLES|nr:hypothetical protein [Colocasia esculenta]